MRLVQLGIFLLASSNLIAQTWNFSTPINVTAPAENGVFHHLESSGRRNIAVSGNFVGIIWEDDSDGTPRIYLAFKALASDKFESKIRISGDGEAYEPSIIGLDNGLFATAWEEEEQVSLRIVAQHKMGPIVKIGNHTSAQVSLANKGDRLMLVYRQQRHRFGQIILQQMLINNQFHLSPVISCPVDPEPLKNDQLYPVMALLNDHINVVWEDRRLGHTIIMASQTEPEEICKFSPPIRISEEPPGPKSEFGAGHGVARAALARFGESGLFAVWADKRDFREGYDIYGAEKLDNYAYGVNVRIQDDFAGGYRQWHATISGNQNGQLVVAWTDEREGSMDIWYSWLEAGSWSDDNIFPGASGKGIQYHPSITLDDSGTMHLAWIHRQVDGGPTQIRYLSASPN